MRSMFMYALVAGLVGATAAGAKDEKDALKELQGTYLIVGLEGKGLKITEEDLKKFGKEDDRKVVIKGNQIIATQKGTDDPATIKLDPSKSPAHIDLTSMKDGKPEVDYGIYKYEKGILTICAGEKGEAKDRPKAFKADDKLLIMKLQKQPAK